VLKKLALALSVVVVGIGAVGYTVYALNTTPPLAPITASEAADPTRPYVVKLHAQWCPVCMLTKGAWSQIAERYAGRVNLLVVDVTNEETAAASRQEAQRLGLERFFDEHSGITGAVAVVDGRSNEVAAFLPGRLALADYARAIDASLAGARSGPNPNPNSASPQTDDEASTLR
jgi:thiol-disulfide isomerase/thioredoxin